MIDSTNCDRTMLNLGSGKNFKPDCWNVDINPKFKPDLVADMIKLKCDKNVFSKVFMHDVLVHVTFAEARVLLRHVKDWMKPDGTLHIHVPNLDYLAEVLFKSDDETLRHEALKWLYGTDGIGTTDYESNKLRWAYTKKSLTKLLKEIGFTVLEYGIDCSSFGLSVVAQK